jgi:hypothetical protein
MNIKKGLAYRRVAGELFVVDAGKARLHELNGSAAVIWEGLAKGLSLAAIAAELAAQFEVEEAAALEDAKEFKKQLLAAGLLAA